MSATGEIYFDDIAVGDSFDFGPYRVTERELLEFNRKWDSLPIHLDNAAARAKGHRGVIASGQYTLCVKQLFMSQAQWRNAAIGALGFDELRFPHPVYVDDELSATMECVDKRISRSKPDRGVVVLSVRIHNQDGSTVLSYIDTAMFARRDLGTRGDTGP
ncbi:MAG: MaoC/PaaZ C-terminal domain-containing protein [Gammaproteobacteria bacterium]|jgi:acyl dehydratase|nr:MaoC/PaaZ C-terminal domain-containing protein [Gammaproteobacteria bacterium]HJP35610.1 MaoC/PaaZ C-terminal domain-containing protein [Gammaproteobacteria bacterium]